MLPDEHRFGTDHNAYIGTFRTFFIHRHIKHHAADLHLGLGVGALDNLSIKYIVLTDEIRYKFVRWMLVFPLGCINLLHNAILQNDNFVTDRHRLGLVVSDIHCGDPNLLLDTANLIPHMHP